MTATVYPGLDAEGVKSPAGETVWSETIAGRQGREARERRYFRELKVKRAAKQAAGEDSSRSNLAIW